MTKGYQAEAYETAREEYGNYFDALEKHPRLLVGTEVPRIGEEGMEILRSTEDAREWQEAVKSILVQEITESAQTKLEEGRDFIETIHASIDLFKNNPDLIPGTKGFNRALADEFAQMATPYEIRHEGKLQGYSIPVQPLIERIRTQLKSRQAAATPAATPPMQPKPKPDPPQAGITTKAGNSSEREDFSTLFGTIGLPNLQI